MHGGSQQVTDRPQVASGYASRPQSAELEGCHLAGVGMRIGLRRGVGTSFSLASSRLRLTAEESVLGTTCGASFGACRETCYC